MKRAVPRIGEMWKGGMVTEVLRLPPTYMVTTKLWIPGLKVVRVIESDGTVQHESMKLVQP